MHLRGDGQEGIGEDVVYDVLDHIAHRDAGPVLDLTGPATLGEACALLGELDLFAGAPPEREPSRHYRRWAYESAALDLALRQSGLALWEVVERDPEPLRFVCSTRLASFGDDAKSTTEPIRKRLDKYPALEFKLDPENDWDAELIAEIAELAPVRVLDLKGHLPRARRSTSRPTPSSTARSPRRSPRPTSRTPTSTPRRRAVLEPHADRVTWDAPLHSLADVKEMAPQGDQLEALAVRLAAGAARDLRVLRRATGSRSTAAARASSSAGAARSSTWRRCFTTTRRTTSRPRATTTRRCPPGCRRARWTRRRREPASAGPSRVRRDGRE